MGKVSSQMGDMQVCIDCPTGRYRNLVGGSSLLEDCFDCRLVARDLNVFQGFECDQVGMAVPFVSSGYYRKSTADPLNIVKCIPDESCLASTLETTQCGEAYEGVHCGACKRQLFYRNADFCIPCVASAWKWIALGIIALILVAFIIRLTTSDYAAQSKRESNFLKLRITLLALQLIATYPRLQTTLPPELLKFYNVLDFGNLNINILGFECGSIFEPYWGLWKVKLFIPAVLLLLFVISFVILGCFRLIYIRFVRLWNRFFKTNSIQNMIKNGLDPYIYGYLMILNVLYTMILAAIFEPLFCFSQPDGTLTMVKNPAVECYSSEWQFNVYAFLIPACIFYAFIVPTALIRLLYKNRTKIQDPKFISRYGFLVNSYKHNLYWYEIVLIFKKVLFVIVPEFLAIKVSISIKQYSGLIILIGFLMIDQIMLPYKGENENRLSIM
jgi:hypothetical protein